MKQEKLFLSEDLDNLDIIADEDIIFLLFNPYQSLHNKQSLYVSIIPTVIKKSKPKISRFPNTTLFCHFSQKQLSVWL